VHDGIPVRRVSGRLDLSRIAELQGVMGAGIDGIVGSLVQSMASAIERAEASIAAGELDEAARAAHLCRNDALMIDAKPLLRALSELESAARDHQLEPARRALDQVQLVWPGTREELERAAGAADPR
jgi:HPt (histidine-containing phosphotransfer) domain-containing protein